MTREDIFHAIEANRESIRSLGVRHLGLFGSYARGDQSVSSDIDFLVDPAERFSLLDLIALKHDLEELTGRNVDIVSRRGISPYLNDDILRQAIPL